MLTLISESESFVQLIRKARTLTRIATEDAALMDELNRLIDLQNEILLTLYEKNYELEQTLAAHYEFYDSLIIEETNLESSQRSLADLEYQLIIRLTEVGIFRVEEQRLARLLEAEEILLRTPPPPTTSPGGSSGQTNPQKPKASGLAHPLPGARVTSEFGPRGGGHHAGIDIQIWGNFTAPVLAAAAGTVTHAAWENGIGWHVIISHNIDGQIVDTLYGHLSQMKVSAGDIISQGQQIGNKGTTGITFSNGHLHFEVHPGGFSWNRGVCPRLWINF